MEGSASITSTSELMQSLLSSLPPAQGKYGDASSSDLVHMTTVFLRIPVIALWFCTKNLILHPKTLKRSTTLAILRWLNSKLNYRQIQYASPPSVKRYIMWATRHQLPVTVEELVDDGMLLWIGPKRRDRVVLCIPGGAYLFPIQASALSFWRYVQLELEKDNGDVGFTVLSYSLLPTAGFPTQLRQAVLAVEHLISTGVHPSKLHIVGDSAGANLILGLLSHFLHPIPSSGVRSMLTPLEAPIRGVYLMSPWVCMKSNTASSRSNAAYDIIVPPRPNEPAYSDLVLAHVTNEHQLPYIDPLNAPDTWFAGLDGIVDKLLMTAGGMEVLRDDIISFSNKLTKTKSNFTFEVQEGGIHDDPILDFMVGLPHDQLGSLTPLIIHWLAAGIKVAP